MQSNLKEYRRLRKEGVDIWEVQTPKGRSWYVRSAGAQTPKRKELIFEKYRRPKKEGADMREVQTDKLWNGKD